MLRLTKNRPLGPLPAPSGDVLTVRASVFSSVKWRQQQSPTRGELAGGFSEAMLVKSLEQPGTP